MNKKVNKETQENEELDDVQSSPPVKLTDFLSMDGTYLTMHINDIVSGDSINNLIDAIVMGNLQAGDERCEMGNLTHINILINSPGGELASTCQLVTAMDSSRIPIRTITWGECASAAQVIFMAGHERLVSPHTILMSHHASFGRAPGMQHVQDMSVSNMADKIHQLMMNFYKKYTKKDSAYIKRNLIKASKDDVYFMADESIRHGLADGYFESFEQLVEPPASKDQTALY